MPRARLQVLALGWCLVLSGCGGGGSAMGSSNPSEISRDELAAGAISTLSVMEAIERLRPSWLRARAASSINSSASQFPAVLLNNVVSNDLSALRVIPVTDVEVVRYVDSRDATTRYGTGYVNGLIEVVTRRGSR